MGSSCGVMPIGAEAGGLEDAGKGRAPISQSEGAGCGPDPAAVAAAGRLPRGGDHSGRSSSGSPTPRAQHTNATRPLGFMARRRFREGSQPDPRRNITPKSASTTAVERPARRRASEASACTNETVRVPVCACRAAGKQRQGHVRRPTNAAGPIRRHRRAARFVCPLPQPTSRTCSPRRGAEGARRGRRGRADRAGDRVASCWATPRPQRPLHSSTQSAQCLPIVDCRYFHGNPTAATRAKLAR